MRAAVTADARFARLAQLAAQRAPQLSPEQVASVATAYAWLAVVPPEPALLPALAARLEALLPVAAPDDICHTLWALSKLSCCCPSLLQAAGRAALDGGWLHELPGKQLASLLWVHARATAAGAPAPCLPTLIDAAVHNLCAPGFPATLTPQELCNVAWSLATCKAAGQLRAVPLQLLALLPPLCEQQVGRFTPQGVANTCWALSKLLGSDSQGAAGSSSGSSSSGTPPAMHVVSASWLLGGTDSNSVLLLLPHLAGAGFATAAGAAQLPLSGSEFGTAYPVSTMMEVVSLQAEPLPGLPPRVSGLPYLRLVSERAGSTGSSSREGGARVLELEVTSFAPCWGMLNVTGPLLRWNVLPGGRLHPQRSRLPAAARGGSSRGSDAGGNRVLEQHVVRFTSEEEEMMWPIELVVAPGAKVRSRRECCT